MLLINFLVKNKKIKINNKNMTISDAWQMEGNRYIYVSTLADVIIQFILLIKNV